MSINTDYEKEKQKAIDHRKKIWPYMEIGKCELNHPFVIGEPDDICKKCEELKSREHKH